MKELFKIDNKNPFKISRSRLEKFIECPRCFYLEMKEGLSRPSMPGFALNVAVDALLKKEFDSFRVTGNPHPLMDAYGIKAVPFQHPNMDEWRNNFKGIRYHHEPTNFIIYGAVDDIWQDEEGRLMIVDYKATSTTRPISLDDPYRQSYKRQMEIYQWLLRKNDFDVSNQGYFVYANGKKDEKAFDGRLEFKIEIISYQGDDQWVEGVIQEAHECLLGEQIPAAGKDCEHCSYCSQRSEIEQRYSH
jgi:CRISPR/Cas system-associated exonuclease Cas4 (RecB family)